MLDRATSPANSGSLRTRLCQRAKLPRGASDSGAVTGSNAGSGNISVFSVRRSNLVLVSKAPSGGSQPVAVAQTPRAIAAPARLHVTVHLSRHTVRPGQAIRVTYSWADGNGTLQYVNHVGPSAFAVRRPLPCHQATPADHASSGHGAWTFVFRPGLTAGLHFPFTSPQRIKVGIAVTTGGCARAETRTATQLVTVSP